jgi:hypothetical protein
MSPEPAPAWLTSIRWVAPSVAAEMELGDPVAGVGEDGAGIVGDRDLEGDPLGATEGEAEVPGDRIEVEGGGGSPEERRSNVGRAGSPTGAEALAVGASEGEGDLRGGDAESAEEAEFGGLSAAEAGELAAGSDVGVEGMAEAEVDEEAEVGEYEAERRGQRVSRTLRGREGRGRVGVPRGGAGEGVLEARPPPEM